MSIDPKAHWYPSLSPYNYAANNPLFYTDPNGEYLDTFIDIASLAVSISDVIADPTSVGNWVSVGLDVVGVALPGVAGLGAIYKGVDKGIDVAKAIDKGVDAAKAGDKVNDLKKTGKAKNKLQPDQNAKANHSTFKTDSDGKTTNHA